LSSLAANLRPAAAPALRSLAVCIVVAVTVCTGVIAHPARAETSATKSATATRSLVLYSAPTQFQYDDFADDRGRGEGNNPFGNYRAPFTALPTDEFHYGPFPGDEAFLEYELYTDTSLKTSAGSAVFICQYGFHKSSFCNASFQLKGGTLAGFLTSTFNATSYTLAITGGTSTYRGLKGEVDGSLSAAAGANASPMFTNPPGIFGRSQRLAFTIQPQTTTTPTHTLVQYAYPAKEQYLDHNDDEARGNEDNPFGPRQYPQCKGLPYQRDLACSAALTKAASAKIEEHNNGPFAGDQAVFTFKIYATADRKTSNGAAVLTCQYYFDKNGYCDVSYKLKDGSLYGAGSLNFTAKQFTFAITGGTGAYSGVTGDVSGTQGANNTQHLAFTLN
jgi:hypothetical protein